LYDRFRRTLLPQPLLYNPIFLFLYILFVFFRSFVCIFVINSTPIFISYLQNTYPLLFVLYSEFFSVCLLRFSSLSPVFTASSSSYSYSFFLLSQLLLLNCLSGGTSGFHLIGTDYNINYSTNMVFSSSFFDLFSTYYFFGFVLLFMSFFTSALFPTSALSSSPRFFIFYSSSYFIVLLFSYVICFLFFSSYFILYEYLDFFSSCL
jgi:hypothetical protein